MYTTPVNLDAKPGKLCCFGLSERGPKGTHITGTQDVTEGHSQWWENTF